MMAGATEMNRRTLGATGPEVSAIGLGCMTMTGGYGGQPDRQEMIGLIRSAVDRGVPDLIDMLVVTIEAGLGFSASLQAASTRVDDVVPVLRQPTVDQASGTSPTVLNTILGAVLGAAMVYAPRRRRALVQWSAVVVVVLRALLAIAARIVVLA